MTRSNVRIAAAAVLLLMQTPPTGRADDFAELFNGGMPQIRAQLKVLAAARPRAARVAYAADPLTGARVPKMTPTELRKGMVGKAYTVWEGRKIEAIEGEVIGTVDGALGRKMILARMRGAKIKHTGIVAGMSGSPFYVDGKLVGAIAFSLGQLPKDPIAGITPIEDMLKAAAFDLPSAAAGPEAPTAAASPELADAAASLANHANGLRPIAMPLGFSGVNATLINAFAPQFASLGFTVDGGVVGGSASGPAARSGTLKPGALVGMELMRGDMSAGGFCTATYVDGPRVLACGHPFNGLGPIDAPMTNAEVVMTYASAASSFKIANFADEIGAFVQDRNSAIVGRLDRKAPMVPVTAKVRGDGWGRTVRVSVVKHPSLFPVLVAIASLQPTTSMLETQASGLSYAVKGVVRLKGQKDVSFSSISADPLESAFSVLGSVARLMNNPYAALEATGVDVEVEISAANKTAAIESVAFGSSSAAPGETVVLNVTLRPYRGAPVVQVVPLALPAQLPDGKLSIVAADAKTMNGDDEPEEPAAKPKDAAEVVAKMNRARANDRVYIQIRLARPSSTDPMMAKKKPFAVLAEFSAPTGYALSGSYEMNISVAKTVTLR